jgi:ATP-dependent Clp protease, protease subunit
MKKFLGYLFIMLFVSGLVFASDITKVNLKGTNKVKNYKLIIDSTRAVVLKGVVQEANITAIKTSLISFKEADPKKPVYIIINSPGGNVIDGFELITLIKSIGIPTYCAIESEAFSMAAILSQYCTKTYIHKYGALMFHEAAYSMEGSASQIDTRVKFMNNYLYTLETDLALQMGISYDKYVELRSKEWWITAKEAAKFGLVDGVLDELYYTAQPPKKEFSFFGFSYNEADGNIVRHPARELPLEE